MKGAARRISKRGFYLSGGFQNNRTFRYMRSKRWSYWEIT